MKRRIFIGRCPLDSISLTDLLPYLQQLVKNGGQHYVCFLEANGFIHANNDLEYRQLLTSATLVLPDGISTIIGARICGESIQDRLTASIVLLEYCKYSTMKGNVRHFFYGGNVGVADKMVETLKRQIPNIKIAGTYCPPFRPLTNDEDLHVKQIIEESKADVVWVGLGAPKQEQWMAEHIGKINVPLFLGIGVTFDYFANTRKRAPALIREIGFEWLYRILTGGRRILFRNIKCVPLMFQFLVKTAVLRLCMRIKNKLK